MRRVFRLVAIAALTGVMVFSAYGGLDAGSFCGDVNGDGTGPNVGDICAEVAYLFIDMPPIKDYRPAEIDGVRGINVLDLIALVDFVFRGGRTPSCVPSGVIDDGAGCLSDSLPARTTGTLELVVDGRDLHVLHHDALANCCPAFFFDYYVEPGSILVVEWDSLYICDCICRFELESVIPELDPGQYTVTVLGVCIYPYAAECDTVGVQTIVVE